MTDKKEILIEEEEMKYTFICYTKWSTCKKAKLWLEENNIEFDERPIKENNPTENELKEWVDKSDYPLKKFFNTSGTLYKDLNLREKLSEMSEGEQIKLLSTDGMLVKRPILIGEDVILVGFKEDEWQAKLKWHVVNFFVVIYNMESSNTGWGWMFKSNIGI